MGRDPELLVAGDDVGAKERLVGLHGDSMERVRRAGRGARSGGEDRDAPTEGDVVRSRDRAVGDDADQARWASAAQPQGSVAKMATCPFELADGADGWGVVSRR